MYNNHAVLLEETRKVTRAMGCSQTLVTEPLLQGRQLSPDEESDGVRYLTLDVGLKLSDFTTVIL